MKIYIDVGHGGKDPGAVGDFGSYKIIERDINLIMACRLQSELEQYEGVQTLLSRTTNNLSAPYDADGIDGSAYRCRLWGGPEYGGPVNLMVSMHNNASGGSGAAFGYDVIYSVMQSNALVEMIGAEFERIGRPKHAIFARRGDSGLDYFGILRDTITNDTTSIIVESAFIDNRKEVEKWIWDPEKGAYRMDKLAMLVGAIVEGIVKHFGLKRKAAPPEPAPAPRPAPVWKGLERLSVALDRIEGSTAVFEVSINGRIHIVNHPIEGE